MPSSDTYFKIDESTPKNAYLLNYLNSSGKSLSQLARDIKVSKRIISEALNNKKLTNSMMIRIAKHFGVDSREIFE